MWSASDATDVTNAPVISKKKMMGTEFSKIGARKGCQINSRNLIEPGRVGQVGWPGRIREPVQFRLRIGSGVTRL